VGTNCPFDSVTPWAVAAWTVVCSRTSTPRRRRTRSAVADRRGVQLGQHPRRQVQQQPAQPLAGQGGALAGGGPGEQLAVGGDLGAGVAGADHHEGAARRPLGRVVAAGRQLLLAHQVVTQPQGFGEAAEAVGVGGDPGDRQQPVDAAGGQQQPVVRHRVALALRVR